MYAYAPCACSALEGQKRPLALLELELQMVLNCHVDPGIQTWVLHRSRQFSEPLSHLCGSYATVPRCVPV